MNNYNLLFLFLSILLCACEGKGKLDPDPTPDPKPYVIPDPNPPSVYKYGLRELARANNLLLGAAFTYNEYAGDDSLEVVLKRDFEAVTFGNEMKHDCIVNSSGICNFFIADTMVGWAKECGSQLFGHTLGWHSQQQTDYLNALISRAAAADAAAAAVRAAHADFVDRMVQHFDTYAWDVVNEVFAEDGNWRTGSVTPANYHVFLWGDYYKGGTKEFVDTAFRTAREALAKYGKKADLYINDYNLEWNPAKLEALCSYAEKNPDVTGVSSQMHCNTDLSEAAIKNMLERMVRTGKKVRISELDVPQGNIPTNTQADVIVSIFKIYLDTVPEKQRGGITFWGVSDKNSWLGKGKNPLLYDTLYKRKDSYRALHAFLLERAGGEEALHLNGEN